MINKQRGEVAIKGPEGKEYILCLTLGAIAQIEEQIDGIDSLVDMDQLMAKPKMGDLLTILVALLNGGGHSEITKEQMMNWRMTPDELGKAISETFAAAGFGEKKEDDSEGN